MATWIPCKYSVRRTDTPNARFKRKNIYLFESASVGVIEIHFADYIIRTAEINIVIEDDLFMSWARFHRHVETT